MNKSIYDIVLNIPTMIRFSMDCSFLKVENNSEKSTMMCHFIFDIFFSYIYLILLGSMLLRIDKNNKISVTILMKMMYFLCWFKSIMGIKNDDKKLFKPIIIDNKNSNTLDNINSDDDSYLNEKDLQLLNTIIKNNLNLDLNNDNEDFSQYENLNKKIFEKVIYKSEKEYLPSSIFIIYKLLFLYFKSNINVYKYVEKTIEDEGIPFQKVIDNKKKDNKNNLKDLNLLKERISRLSRISIDNREKIIPFKKFELKQLMNSLDDKIIKEDFIKYIIKDDEDNTNKNKINNNENKENRNLSNNSNYDNYEFSIESILNEILFELYPFYQISINDILNSLEIGNNRDLLYFFFENRIKNSSFNTYYTSDSFLTFEIYEHNSILYSQLQNFISNYKTYLMEKLSNFSFTFLPLLLGIYNIKYLNYNKIIFLYRNPLAFTPFINFKNWINFTFNDGNEIKDFSTTNTEILDLNEIEVKNNIELEDEEYKEIIQILKEDMEFLKTQNFELNFNLNLIVVNDVKKKINEFSIDDSINNEIDTSKVLKINQNLDNNNKNDLEYMVRESTLFRESILSKKNFKKYYGSDVVSLLEKLYDNNVVENLYIFKIYFTEIFKKKKRIISKDNSNNNNLDNSNNISIQNINSLSLDENEIRENNKKYCNFLKTKLLRKIRKSNSSFLNSFDNTFQMAIQEN